ncbi:MAG TPA: L-glutamate gamma-semialdehyde dehydrogenase, partial [Paracoccaceae bacterium]|nr:L-glutamate gamma-semialdehyde dehydrogenase [Paracoccaceae bacterium]
REAVDFLRYYAAEAAAAEPNTEARGTIACISPWNFPLAIFTGQVAAALVTGNAVLAKPAEQTPLVAARAVQLLHAAGIPSGVLQYLPGDGRVGALITALPGLGGVCFTGSTEVAKLIDRQLGETAPEAMLIAETGGLNAMIVDSTALPEQAVRDILASAFQSAGQRCSALRILYVQEEVAPTVIEMLRGAIDCLVLGDPWRIATDVGPVIDAEAKTGIEAWTQRMGDAGRVLHRLEAPEGGQFVGPLLVRLDGIGALEREVFGPVLHVATFAADALDRVIGEINARGFGLTMGLHTRIDARVQAVVDAARVGNLYVNRNQIGAVVGVQPFGGEGFSGTGPKAGGPHYLPRFRRPRDGMAPDPAEAPRAGPVELSAALARLPATGWGADRIARLRTALRGRAAAAMAAVAALEMGPVDLPGPTGEANQLRLIPRGRVLALGPDPESLLAQCVLALGTGNRVLALAPGAPEALQPLLAAGAPLVALGAVAEPADIAALDADAVACLATAPAHAALRRALAARDGPIRPLVARLDCPAEFTLERVLTVDTTAAGGNAELMARAG